MQADTCLCIFVKPPKPGKVKTRLIPAFGAEGAAALAEAFFFDTWNLAMSVTWAESIIASTDAFDPEFLPDPGAEVWLQGNGDLGERIERILGRGLAQKSFAIAVGADSPGIPRRFLDDAHEALRSADAVLGPCSDGGFYLLGARDWSPGLLADIPWSQPTTFARTLDRLRARGLNTMVLDPWFDVDGAEDVVRLAELITAGIISAPRSASTLARLDGNRTSVRQAIATRSTV